MKDSIRSNGISPVLTILLGGFALGVGVYPSLVLGQATARPLWDNSLLLMPLFLLLGAHSGLACLQLLTSKKWSEESQAFIRKLDISFIGIQIVLSLLLITSASISPIGKDRLLFGEFYLWFWGGVVLIGWVIPLLLSIHSPSRKQTFVLRQICFLGGAFALRTIIILGGQGPESFIGA